LSTEFKILYYRIIAVNYSNKLEASRIKTKTYNLKSKTKICRKQTRTKITDTKEEVANMYLFIYSIVSIIHSS